MDLSMWFWLICFLWLVMGAAKSFASQNRWVALGVDLLPFLAICILGYAVFGSAIK